MSKLYLMDHGKTPDDWSRILDDGFITSTSGEELKLSDMDIHNDGDVFVILTEPIFEQLKPEDFFRVFASYEVTELVDRIKDNLEKVIEHSKSCDVTAGEYINASTVIYRIADTEKFDKYISEDHVPSDILGRVYKNYADFIDVNDIKNLRDVYNSVIDDYIDLDWAERMLDLAFDLTGLHVIKRFVADESVIKSLPVYDDIADGTMEPMNWSWYDNTPIDGKQYAIRNNSFEFNSEIIQQLVDEACEIIEKLKSGQDINSALE